MNAERGLGKCAEHHIGSFGYATRPENSYDFCPRCGNPMLWSCPSCKAPLPDDSDELTTARFCRECGAPYFPGAGDTGAAAE